MTNPDQLSLAMSAEQQQQQVQDRQQQQQRQPPRVSVSAETFRYTKILTVHK